MAWTLRQFGTVVTDLEGRVDQDVWEEMECRMATLRELGNRARRPVTAPLEDGIFELRADVGNRHARLLFYYSQEREIVFVHGIPAKKTRKTPRAAIDIAKRNRAIVLSQERTLNAIPVQGNQPS